MSGKIFAASLVFLFLGHINLIRSFTTKINSNGKRINLTQRNERISDRRSFFSNVVVSSSIFGAIYQSPGFLNPAMADVSDGNQLPQGARQFQRLLFIRSENAGNIKKLSAKDVTLDKKEWDKLSDFLRTLYGGGEDMKIITKTMKDPEKKKKADETVKLVQKMAQAGEGPLAKEDVAGFLQMSQNSAKLFDTFFELLQDVPDEI